jgi:pteridine reductase
MKTALITGGAVRIGAQIVKTLHENNYRVLVHYHQSKKNAQILCNELNTKISNSAEMVCTNLNSLSNIEKLSSKIESIDLLINNASVFYPTPLPKTKHEDWDNLINVNLKAPYFLATQLSNKLCSRNGSIINIVDIHSERPLRNHPIYSISKAGLKMLTLSLAKELAPNVRVNGISPGSIIWPQTKGSISDNQKKIMLDRVALKRQGKPKDIAEAVLFLVESDYITGQIINIDGGRTLYQ